MSKFISKIDGKVFQTKEEILNYLEKQYVKVEELEDSSKYSQILSKLNEVFPDSVIEVSEHKNDNTYYIELGLYTDENRVENFEFIVGDGDVEYDSYSDQTFENVEEAIEFYERYPNQTELIKRTLSEKYDLQSFKINQWYESKDYDSYHAITLDVVLNGVSMHLECGLNQSIESFIDSEVEPYLSNEIEGELTNSHYDGWYVGGSNLYKFLHRAKKVRVTIIE